MAKEKEDIPVAVITLTIGLLVAGISVWYGQNNHLLPEQVSEQAPLVDDLFNLMVAIGTALFLIVEGTILYTLIRFRHRSEDQTDGPPIKENFSLEVFWTAIPAFVVIGLGVYSVIIYNQMGGFDTVGSMAHHHHHGPVQVASLPNQTVPLLAEGENSTPTQPKAEKYGLGGNPAEARQAPDLVVNVTGLQYAWIFTYPEQNITTGELHIPLNQDVQLNINAQDVLHSFWLPQFRIKQDAIPGQPSELRFIATKTGSYPVVCAELCGAYHGSMRTTVVVHPVDEFTAWVKENGPSEPEETPSESTVSINEPSANTRQLANYSNQLGLNAESLAQLHH